MSGKHCMRSWSSGATCSSDSLPFLYMFDPQVLSLLCAHGVKRVVSAVIETALTREVSVAADDHELEPAAASDGGQ